MKKTLLIPILLTVLAFGCMDDHIRIPARIAVVFDLTSSANSQEKNLDQTLYQLLLPLVDSLLPKGSRVAFFNVSPELNADPSLVVPFEGSKYTKSARTDYNKGPRRAIHTKLENMLSSTYKSELEDPFRFQARSCIDNTLLRAGDFLQEGGDNTQKVLFIVSDLLEQCDGSELMNGGFWLHSAAKASQTPLDSAQSALDNWDGGKPLSGTKVYFKQLQQEIAASTLGIDQKEFRAFWTDLFTRWGAVSVNPITIEIPKDLGLTP
jgi:hypothetical protein